VKQTRVRREKKKAKVPGTKGTVAKTSRNRVLEKARKKGSQACTNLRGKKKNCDQLLFVTFLVVYTDFFFPNVSRNRRCLQERAMEETREHEKPPMLQKSGRWRRRESEESEKRLDTLRKRYL
jgi:hypothetical protein